jgi:hypothetical protein
MEKNDFLEMDSELQRLAFNLADTLDTLNYHSLDETVDDLRKNVFSMSREMGGHIRKILKNLEHVAGYFPDAGVTEIEASLKNMDSLLEVVNKCTGEVKNYKTFVGSLIPLLKLCGEWGERGPLAAAGVY